MSKSGTRDRAASVHARLLDLARSRSRPFNEVLQYFAIERFLYRLALSRYAGQFILKGALLFRLWGFQAYRPTRDIDLLGQIGNDMENLVAIIREVCQQPVQEDGLCFDPESVTGEPIQEGADYEGIRLRLGGLLGKARVHLQIDVGFADVVTPAAREETYPVILSMPAPELRSYPPETVVAEKLQAMIRLGTVNSRMKDFYDLWVLMNRFPFEKDVLQEAIRLTFQQRDTEIPAEEPGPLSPDFGRTKQVQWRAFLKTNAIMDAPDEMGIVLAGLQGFVAPIFRDLRAGRISGMKWRPGGPWEG